MKQSVTDTYSPRQAFKQPLLWAIGISYMLLAAYGMCHHEPWGDEIHSWNIVKGSNGWWNLLQNIRYEGHPPLWYTLMWPVSLFTHQYGYIQILHLCIAGSSVFLLLFYAPFDKLTKCLLPAGYYLFYEYALLSRNYAIGVLLACCICMIMRRRSLYHTVVYYGLLLLLSNTHLLGLLLAMAFQLYRLMVIWQQKQSWQAIGMQAIIGALVLFPSLWFIFPPSDSALNTGFWWNKWDATQFILTAQAPWRALVPVPAWWQHHSWNTNFLLELHRQVPFLKYSTPLMSCSLVLLCGWVLKASKKSLALFGANLLLTCLVSVAVFPVTWARYVGFIYVGFLAAYWLYGYEARPGPVQRRIVQGMLIIQLVAAGLAYVKDIRHPFSQLPRVNQLLHKIPPGNKVVTDYWALNAIAAFANRPFYCVDLQKEVSFLLWDRNQARMQRSPHRYVDGLLPLFKKEKITTVYLLTLHTPGQLARQDTQLMEIFLVKEIARIDGAIEKDSNLYLYALRCRLAATCR